MSDFDKKKTNRFGRLDIATDATGRMIRDWDASKPKKKPILSTRQRKEAILKDKEANFKVVSNPKVSGDKPWYALHSYSEVKANEKTIEREAKKAGVNPDMVKAIVHLETTHGAYDRAAEITRRFGKENETIRPMNVHAEYWKDLGYSRKDLEDSQKNIQAGVELLKRIQERMPSARPAKVASVYNSLGAKRVSNYGARIERLMKEKPWK